MEEARNGRKGRKEAATEEKRRREREMEIGGRIAERVGGKEGSLEKKAWDGGLRKMRD